MLALCKIEVTKGLTITAPMMKSSTPKLPADPVSFDVNRRQNTRTAKELNKTPTTRTLFTSYFQLLSGIIGAPETLSN